MADSEDHLELGAASVIHDTELHLPHHAIIRPVWQQPWAFAFAGLLIFALIATLSYGWKQGYRFSIASGVNVAIGPPPPVEPFLLKKISMNAARETNTAVPFVKGPFPAAEPFRMAADFSDVERAVDCLAANIFYEAGNEAVEGQMAVAQVVLNRMRHPAYPKTVCGVVFQGEERRTGCQFSFTCDGSMRRQPNPIVWERLRGMARSMLFGTVYAPVGLATHYHTDWVVPAWSAKLDKLRAERTHLFFRWTGYWGTPKAFTGKHPGMEPAIPKMAILSTAHRTADTNIAEIMAGLTPEGAIIPDGANTTGPIAEIITPVTADERVKNSFFLQVETSSEPAMLVDLATTTCKGRDYCKVMVWVDPYLMPMSAEMNETQRTAIVFSYLRNKQQGFEKALWNCALFPRPDKRQCMKRPAPPAPAPLAKPDAKPDMKAIEQPPQ